MVCSVNKVPHRRRPAISAPLALKLACSLHPVAQGSVTSPILAESNEFYGIFTGKAASTAKL
jgi:hypothetical protein